MTWAHLNEIAECGDRDILAHALTFAEVGIADVVAVRVADRIGAVINRRLQELFRDRIAESVPLCNFIHHQVRHDGMAHRLRAFQPAEHFLDAVQVMVRPINPVPLCLVIGGLFIFPPDGDRVIAHILIEFFLLPAARDQLRREVEIVCQLLFEQHMELLPHLGAHIVIPTRGKFDEPYNVRLVLRLQVCIVTRIKTHDTVRHIVIDRRIRHVLQHQPIQLKRELMAVAPANSGAIARIAAATAALKTVRACLRHKCQRIFHAPPLDEIRADRKRVGLLARAGEIEVRVRLRLQTGEIGNALLHRPGPDDRFGRRVHDLELRAVRHIRAAGPHGCPIVIADLVDKDLRIFDLRRRASQRQILRLFGALRRDHAGIDRDVVKQRHRVVHAQTDLTARRARIIFKLFDAIDIADHLFARYCHAQPVRLSVLYLCLMFRRRSDRAVLVRPPQKLRTCFYAMIQPEMVKLRPIRLLERHARAVSAAVQSLHQSYVRHDGIFRGQITRHRQRRQKSAAVPAACALGSAPVSAAIAATGITDSSRQSTSSRQSHLCVFFIPFPP